MHTLFVVGWDLSNSMSAEWFVGIVSESILIHGKLEILMSDHCSRFTSEVYVSLLQMEGIRISIDGKGRAIDNIFLKRLWCSIRYEPICLYAYDDGLSLY